MTENFKKHPFIDTSESSAFMYKVTMVVQVIAPNKELADIKLDQDGGYVSKRDVEFVRSILLYKSEESEESKEIEENEKDSE
jgi:hypothetical protein